MQIKKQIEKWRTAACRSVAVAGAAVSASLIMSACQQSPTAPATVANPAGAGQALAAKADKVDVCHREGNGSYHLINVSGNALSAHLAHGDGQPGGSVPGNPTKQFDAACGQVDVAPHTAFVPGESCGQTVTLSCPAGTVIQVTEGLYGQSCADIGWPPSPPAIGDGNPDKTADLAQSCDGLGSCNYVIDCSPGGIGDPFFGCRKDYRAEWVCVSE